MNGFISRADPYRKYFLGVMGIYGDEPNLEVRGVWMWRGTEILPYLNDHPQFEYFDKVKLDINNEADRALIVDYWTKLEEDKDKVEGLTVRAIKLVK